MGVPGTRVFGAAPNAAVGVPPQVAKARKVPLKAMNIANAMHLPHSGTFVFEATTKLCAYGCAEYFISGWHKFDFTVVCLALPDVLEALGIDANLNSALPNTRTLAQPQPNPSPEPNPNSNPNPNPQLSP